MSRNGAGVYSLPAGNPVTTGTAISSTVQNNTTADIATALTASIAYDGQTTPIANLPMGGYKHTGAADGSANSDYATLGQVRDSFGTQLTSVSGADTITATTTPAPSAYAAGQRFSFVAAGANTTAVTLNVNSLGAKAVTRNGSTALVAGEIPSGGLILVEYDGTRFQILNPSRDMPTGTVVAFFQAAAPIGWTQVTTHNNKAMRIVNGTGGGSGGSVAFTTAFASQSVTGSNSATTLASTQIPTHTHGFAIYSDETGTGSVCAAAGVNTGTVNTDGGTGGGGPHNHTFTGTAINLAVQYIDMILASKN